MTSPVRKLKEPERPALALHDRAMDNLRYIRETMERSAAFTHVSGAGGVLMGAVAVAASVITWNASNEWFWLGTWVVAAMVAMGISVAMMAKKSRAEGVTLLSGPGRRFAWNMIPPLTAGAVLTVVLARRGQVELLPGIWLLLYGTSVVTGGSYSVRPIPIMGAVFMLAGVGALLSPAAWGDVFMAAGFGGLHVVFGLLIWRKYGG